MVKDPVCGKEIDETQWNAPDSLIRRWKNPEVGPDVFFHDMNCRNKFLANPELYLAQQGSQAS